MMSATAFSGLDWLSTATVALTGSARILSVNSAAESLFQHSRRHLIGMRLSELVPPSSDLHAAIDKALATQTSYTEQALEVRVGVNERATVSCTVNVIDSSEVALLIEFRRIDQQLKAERDERMQAQLNSNREFIRNLAHEIKNPLGGVRGAAQLLARELASPQLTEYTQVIIAETDRLQNLLNRLLTPNRPVHRAALNIHEVLNHVVTLIDAEFNYGEHHVDLVKDFDVSLPLLQADREQLTQAFLNIVRNAAQVLTQHKSPSAQIKVATRIARGVTVARRRFKLAILVTVSDNGPGIPEDIIDTVFHPLVSRREGGTGLGLTIAQTFVAQHNGLIEVQSAPGATRFSISLPLDEGSHV
jgi:two-component system, NtrC family, nitrogen regulation sensor histidine kinase GlnL